MKSLLSIHDVMPSTLEQVQGIIDSLPKRCLPQLTLLIVPGLKWNEAQLQRLSRWQQLGIHYAGHGWVHNSGAPRGFIHRLHSLLISRRAAEHLALSRPQLNKLLSDNYSWFERHALRSPTLYVPPAWALGRLKPQDLAASSFSLFELTSCVIEADSGRKRFLPLVGFEADTLWRAVFLRVWNKCNELVARFTHTALRIAIHPYDCELHLARDIPKLLQRVDSFITYQELLAAPLPETLNIEQRND